MAKARRTLPWIRGPVEVDPTDGWQIALGHRRLSILDLSDAGKQPMTLDGQIWITFNGEVYNYLELRDQLIALGYTFSTGTDTEVILVAYAAWGTECFSRFRGMFGLAILDGRRSVLVLARDRFGIKPLYWMTVLLLQRSHRKLNNSSSFPAWNSSPTPQPYTLTC